MEPFGEQLNNFVDFFCFNYHAFIFDETLSFIGVKVEKIYEDILDSISTPSPSVKIQIIGGKVYLW